LSKGSIFFADANPQAIDTLRQVLRAGDIILVKGSRGAKMEEIVAALARPNENGGRGTDQWRIP
jgi:UDP-N-acetylmuramyl pentapeptide synthase